MAFQKSKKQPTFADLKGILSQTQLDNITYQLLETLIDRLIQYQNTLTEAIVSLTTNVTEIKTNPPSGSNGTVALHAYSHGPYGNDPVFLLPSGVVVEGERSLFSLYDINSPVENRRWKFINYGDGKLLIEPTSDDGATAQNQVIILHRNGLVEAVNLTTQGSDGNVAAKNQLNIFTQNQVIDAIQAELRIIDTIQPTNLKVWRIQNKDQKLYIVPSSDAGDINYATLSIDRLGSIITSGNITASNLTSANEIRGITLITSGNDALRLQANGIIRTHYKDTSRPVGVQTHVFIKSAGSLYIVPTNDDGTIPANNDLAYSLSVSHSGLVATGLGGLAVRKVVNDSGLAHGTYLPTAIQSQNVTTISMYYATYMRVGNVVTVSGGFDAAPAFAGTRSIIRVSVPISNISSGSGTMVNTSSQAGYIGNSLVDDRIDFAWVPPNLGLIAWRYTYTYQIA